MRHDKVKIECKLTANGSDKINAKVIDDLSIEDPDEEDGKRIIEKSIGDNKKDDSRTGNTGKSKTNNRETC